MSINFSKARTKVCMSFYYNDGNKYLHVNKTEICKFETRYKIRCMGFVYEVYQKILQKMNRVKFL